MPLWFLVWPVELPLVLPRWFKDDEPPEVPGRSLFVLLLLLLLSWLLLLPGSLLPRPVEGRSPDAA